MGRMNLLALSVQYPSQSIPVYPRRCLGNSDGLSAQGNTGTGKSQHFQKVLLAVNERRGKKQSSSKYSTGFIVTV